MYQILPVLGLTLCAAALYWKNRIEFLKRIQNLEQDLQCLSNVMSQMVEVQTETHRRHVTRFEDLEERIMDLSIPSPDSDSPLERRHQVLALARQGIGIEEIVSRLKAPAGEAELILNLRKFMNEKGTPKVQGNEQGSQNAQISMPS
jgi:hypothetical protein